jgi:hypothetical protein
MVMRWLVPASFGVLLLAASQSEASIAVSAGSGHAYYAVDEPCFQRTYTRIKNVCPSRTYWVMDFPIEDDTDLFQDVAVYGKGATTTPGSASLTECYMHILDEAGSVVAWSGGLGVGLTLSTTQGWKYLGSFPTTHYEGQSVQVECAMGANGSGWVSSALLVGS